MAMAILTPLCDVPATISPSSTSKICDSQIRTLVKLGGHHPQIMNTGTPSPHSLGDSLANRSTIDNCVIQITPGENSVDSLQGLRGA